MGQEREDPAGPDRNRRPNRRHAATDAAQTINGWIESHANAATNSLSPADSAASRPKTDDDQPIAVPSTPAPAPKKADSGTSSGGGAPMDKQKLDALINKNAPFAPAPKQ